MQIPYHFTKEGGGVLITKLNDHPNTRFILFSDGETRTTAAVSTVTTPMMTEIAGSPTPFTQRSETTVV